MFSILDIQDSCFFLSVAQSRLGIPNLTNFLSPTGGSEGTITNSRHHRRQRHHEQEVPVPATSVPTSPQPIPTTPGLPTPTPTTATSAPTTATPDHPTTSTYLSLLLLLPSSTSTYSYLYHLPNLQPTSASAPAAPRQLQQSPHPHPTTATPHQATSNPTPPAYPSYSYNSASWTTQPPATRINHLVPQLLPQTNNNPQCTINTEQHWQSHGRHTQLLHPINNNRHAHINQRRSATATITSHYSIGLPTSALPTKDMDYQ
jgi:hypothetical protein